MIKFKHTYYREGSGTTQEDGSPETIDSFLQGIEDWVNNNQINPVEISHDFTINPTRCLSVFISYVDIAEIKEETTKAIEAVNEQKAADKKKGNSKKKSPKAAKKK